MERDICYYCQKQGHWAINCPKKSITNKTKSEPSCFTNINGGGDSAFSIPDRECPCGAGTCLVLTSSTSRNPNRKFYKCPAKGDNKCPFFEWVKLNKTHDVPVAKNQGHGSIGSFDRFKNKSEPSMSTGPNNTNINGNDLASIRDKYCPCGAGTCLKRTSNSANNPNRNYYNCPGKPSENCNFFEWCDTAKFDEKEDVPGSPYPLCSCGAGKCSIYTMKDGSDTGRNYFACPVKRGQGACNFFKWQDTEGNTRNDNHISEGKQLSSPGKTFDDCEQTTRSNEATDADGYTNGDEETISPGSAAKELRSPLPGENHSKENISGLNSGVDALRTPIGNLQVTDTKPGNCYRCGKEGHWAQDCLKSSSKSLCFKCGKVGHWMIKCPN